MSEIPDADTVAWLSANSMLQHAKDRAKSYSGQARLWQQPYAAARPRAAIAVASVWITTYPASIVTEPGRSVIATLGDERLWQALSNIGIQGMHTGPLKRAGGINGRTFTETVDGNFDRISNDIDPHFGTQEEFIAMSRTAAAHNAIIIDDIVPAHTGKGPDFRLAELAHQDYPGLYHMVAIREEDWDLLPSVPDGADAANLSPTTVDQLREKRYIVGQLQRVIFFEPGVKETDWSATEPITGTDGITRRWVYLHYFKGGQPSLNWLDPSFAAQQLIVGDALHSLDALGARMLRLDANGFLGVERRSNGPAWSEGHPLSGVSNQLIAGMIRKAGAFSFQELNLAVDDIAALARGGPDLSYDFITRPAYHHALVTGRTDFLRLMLRIMTEYGIDPASLIHALQNHDELTLELVHFWTLHADETFTYADQTFQGRTLREHIREVMYDRLCGANAPYNLRFVTNGVACTTVSFIAAALGITDLRALTDADRALIRRAHLLLVMYNAFQPGVFALSGWDLVGALPLDEAQVAHLMTDGDTRWIERGAYDLLGAAPPDQLSTQGLPPAPMLYGSLPEQLATGDSFVCDLKRLLAVRQSYGLATARQLGVADTLAPGLLVLIHELPAERGIQLTVLNFGRGAVDEEITLHRLPSGPVVDMLNERVVGDLTDTGRLTIRIEGLQGQSLRVVGTLPAVLASL